MLPHSAWQITPARAARPRHLRAVVPAPPWKAAPRWGWLYTTLLIVVVIGVSADVLVATEAWRRLVEIVTAVGVLGSMAIWLKLNRLRLACDVPHADGQRARRVVRSETPSPVPGPPLPRSSAR